MRKGRGGGGGGWDKWGRGETGEAGDRRGERQRMRVKETCRREGKLPTKALRGERRGTEEGRWAEGEGEEIGGE